MDSSNTNSDDDDDDDDDDNTLFECCMLYIVSIQMTADVGHVAHFDSADSRMQHPYGCCI